jgi:Xaa-Pro aminopeptidase
MIAGPDRDELRARRSHLIEAARMRGAAGCSVFRALTVFYLTGFAFIPTERPVALVIAGDGRTVLFIPRLEEEHAGQYALVDEIVAYPEYPGEHHPMIRLAALIRDRVGAGALAVDSDGYPGGFGYQGPALSEILHGPIVGIAGVVDDLMAVKSPSEVDLLRESARWAAVAHDLLQRATRAGMTELEVSEPASQAATAQMVSALGPAYRPHGWMTAGARAHFRGQIGAASAIPHSLITNARIAPGDVLVTGATAAVTGYYSELERTMVAAPVSPEAARLFRLMVGAQEVARDALRPGRPCASVDRAVLDYFERHDLMPYWRHHTGHAIGIGIPNHAAPYLDVGDQTEIREGMVFSLEPGIYVPGLGGFRHSDTVLVTGAGAEDLTDYPRTLDALTIA